MKIQNNERETRKKAFIKKRMVRPSEADNLLQLDPSKCVERKKKKKEREENPPVEEISDWDVERLLGDLDRAYHTLAETKKGRIALKRFLSNNNFE